MNAAECESGSRAADEESIVVRRSESDERLAAKIAWVPVRMRPQQQSDASIRSIE